MPIEFIVAFVVLLLVLALATQPLAARLGMPHTSVLVISGAGVAYFMTLGLGIDTGLRAANFHDLIFYVFLPVLIFDAAFKIPLGELSRNLTPVLFLAIIGMLLTTSFSAGLLYYGIGHDTGFPWLAALMAGALLAATDPVAVVAQLKTLGAPERLGVLLEGESLFNDATAIVLFTILLTLATMPEADVTIAVGVFKFFQVFLGGGLIGAAFGLAGRALLKLSTEGTYRVAVTLAAAYGSFLIAEAVLHVSGVMGSLVAGLVIAGAMDRNEGAGSQVDFFWSALAYIANGSVFLLMGFTITVAMFTERWLAMLIAIAAVLAARAATTFGGLGALNLIMKQPVPLPYQSVMVWGGLRGAVTLGLALSIPIELDYWFTIQSMAFGLVLFTLLVQAPSMPWLIRRVGVIVR